MPTGALRSVPERLAEVLLGLTGLANHHRGKGQAGRGGVLQEAGANALQGSTHMDMDAQTAVSRAQCHILHHPPDLYAKQAQTAFAVGGVGLLIVSAEKEQGWGQIGLNVRAGREADEEWEDVRCSQCSQSVPLWGVRIDIRWQIPHA